MLTAKHYTQSTELPESLLRLLDSLRLKDIHWRSSRACSWAPFRLDVQHNGRSILWLELRRFAVTSPSPLPQCYPSPASCQELSGPNLSQSGMESLSDSLDADGPPPAKEEEDSRAAHYGVSWPEIIIRRACLESKIAIGSFVESSTQEAENRRSCRCRHFRVGWQYVCWLKVVSGELWLTA
jgi:hypothetical protein